MVRNATTKHIVFGKLFSVWDCPVLSEQNDNDLLASNVNTIFRIFALMSNHIFPFEKQRPHLLFDGSNEIICQKCQNAIRSMKSLDTNDELDEIIKLAMKECSLFKFYDPTLPHAFNEIIREIMDEKLHLDDAIYNHLKLIYFYDMSHKIVNMSLKKLVSSELHISEDDAKAIVNRYKTDRHDACIGRGYKLENKQYSMKNDYIFSLMFGGSIAISDVLKYRSIFDFLIAKGLIATVDKRNPFSNIVECYENNEYEQSVLPLETSGRQLLNYFEEYSNKFSVNAEYKASNDTIENKLLPYIQEGLENPYFSGLLSYIIERFSNINMIICLTNLHLKILNNCKEGDDEFQLFDGLWDLSVCPLLSFRIAVIKYLYKIDNSSIVLNRNLAVSNQIVDYTHYLSFTYLPILQLVFRTLLLIFRIIYKRFPKGSFDYPSTNLFDINTNFRVSTKEIPDLQEGNEELFKNSLIKVGNKILKSYYESITLPNKYSFDKLLFDYFDYESKLDYCRIHYFENVNIFNCNEQTLARFPKFNDSYTKIPNSTYTQMPFDYFVVKKMKYHNILQNLLCYRPFLRSEKHCVRFPRPGNAFWPAPDDYIF